MSNKDQPDSTPSSPRQSAADALIEEIVKAPVRVERVYVQHLEAPPEKVFPTLCPVEEVRWVDGWEPSSVLTVSGRAEPDCVFVTGSGEGESVWVVTEHDPENFRLSMVKVIPKIGVTVIRIELEAKTGEDGQPATAAHVAYQRTALGAEGEGFVASFTEEAYEIFMKRWEEELNHYLRTGENLSSV